MARKKKKSQKPSNGNVSIYRFFSSTICSTAILIATSPINVGAQGIQAASGKTWLKCRSAGKIFSCSDKNTYQIVTDPLLIKELEKEYSAANVSSISTTDKEFAELLSQIDGILDIVSKDAISKIQKGMVPDFSTLRIAKLSESENEDLKSNLTSIFSALKASNYKTDGYVAPQLNIKGASLDELTKLQAKYVDEVNQHAAAVGEKEVWGIISVTFVVVIGAIIGWTCSSENETQDWGQGIGDGTAPAPDYGLSSHSSNGPAIPSQAEPYRYVPSQNAILEIRDAVRAPNGKK